MRGSFKKRTSGLSFSSYLIQLSVTLGTYSCSKPINDELSDRESSKYQDTSPSEELARDPKDDDDSINEPIMVGGSFLTCAVDESIPVRGNTIASGCRLEFEGSKTTLSDEIRTSIAFYNIFNVEVAVEVIEATLTSPWHWILYIPLAEFHDAKVEATFFHVPSETTAQKVSIISSDPIAIEQPSAYKMTLGQYEDFHLGDSTGDKPVLSQACSESLQQINHSAPVLIFPFEITEDETMIGITLEGICDVNEDNNLVFVREGENSQFVASEKKLSRNSDHSVLKGFKAKKGAYELVIQAADGKKQDNFVVGQITFSSNSELILGEPVESKK